MHDTLLKEISKFLATGAYSGYLPKMPGTWGSFWGAFLFLLFPQHTYFGATFLITVIGIIATREFLKTTSDSDPSCVVIDEIIGVGLVFSFVLDVLHLGYGWCALGFFLFRVFDMIKVGIVKIIDDYQTPCLALRSLFIQLDDIVAALQAVLVVWAASSFF